MRSLSHSKSLLHVGLPNTVMECFIESFTLTKSEGKKVVKVCPWDKKKKSLSEKNTYSLGGSCFEKTFTAFKDYLFGNFRGIKSLQ